MTEIPEHLLARSKQRRSALTGEGDTGEAPVPAKVETDAPAASTPAPAAAEAPAAVAEKEPEPTPPWVEAAQSRKKIPVWAVPVLVALPFFFIIYAGTLDEPTAGEGPLAMGAEVYGVSCAGCHGGGGGGGAGPALAGGAVVETFPAPAEQVAWVALGSSGFQDAGFDTYGEQAKPIAGGMPGQMDTMDATEMMESILHERVEFGGEAFDAALWEEGFEETLAGYGIPEDKIAEYFAIVEEWAANPPA